MNAKPTLRKTKPHDHEWGYWIGIHGQQTTVEECLVCGIARAAFSRKESQASADKDGRGDYYLTEGRAGHGSHRRGMVCLECEREAAVQIR